MQLKETLNRIGRSKDNQMIGGICAGFAEETGTPAWLWRAGTVLAALHFGIGVVVYLVLWALMPVRSKVA